MSVFELEYTICQIQSGRFSMAAKSHRQEGGNPILEVGMSTSHVEWRLQKLDHGVPETVAGAPRVDRIDFYFRHEVLKSSLPLFPTPRATSNPSLKWSPLDSAGKQRNGGIGVRMVAPVCRFFPVEDVSLFSRKPPAFEARANDATLHLDMETGPARIYGSEIFEVHFGIEAQYEINPLGNPVPSHVVLLMSDALYATILAELQNV